jgi:hypothetical protein
VRFDDLVAEAAAASVDGWEFSWLDGRASEERPSWGYAEAAGPFVATTTRFLIEARKPTRQ